MTTVAAMTSGRDVGSQFSQSRCPTTLPAWADPPPPHFCCWKVHFVELFWRFFRKTEPIFRCDLPSPPPETCQPIASCWSILNAVVVAVVVYGDVVAAGGGDVVVVGGGGLTTLRSSQRCRRQNRYELVQNCFGQALPPSPY